MRGRIARYQRTEWIGRVAGRIVTRCHNCIIAKRRDCILDRDIDVIDSRIEAGDEARRQNNPGAVAIGFFVLERRVAERESRERSLV